MPRPLPTPRDRASRFVNWARTTSTGGLTWQLPADEVDVVDAVRSARTGGRRIRLVGAGHSWSGVNVPDDIAMSLDRMPQTVQVAADRQSVTVGGGVRLRDLSAALASDGLVLPIVGSIQSQSMAGAIATGTHGSSLGHGNLSSLVTSMRVVTGTGEVVDVPGGDERLDAMRVHLGALGVVTRVTVPVRPARRLCQTVTDVPVADVPALLPEVAHSADYVKVWWLPHAPMAQIVRYADTDAPITRRPSAATARWIDERVMHRFVFPGLVAFQRRRPGITVACNTFLSRRYLGRPTQVGPDALMLNTPMPIRHRETEAALPLDRAPDATAQVLGVFRAGRPAVTFPLEIRFVRADGGWLSPAAGADTCQIGAYAPEGPDCSSYFRDFWSVMRPLGARPHWGKEMDHDAAALRPLYPRYDDFVALRDALDPDRVFGGPFHARVLGD